ncbi:MAG TPA: HAMP domain-containing sensor histidine kinase [Labilithrix sp.]|nr:HAMP domain-containing sensor histidine kinase [Labilithrix sp.]
MNLSDIDIRGQIVVGVVGEEQSSARAAILEAIDAAGAEAESCTEATAISRGSGVDALVFDIGGDADSLLPVAVSLGSDPRTRWLPRVLVVDQQMSAARIGPFGAGSIVLSDAPPQAFRAALAATVEQVHSRNELIRMAKTATVNARAFDEMFAAVQREGTALSHDARVLFGVILGFASNLRDGFAGPITEEQHRHLINIVEASTDAAALLDHYVTGLRRTVPRSTEPPRSIVPRVAARRHNDLGEIVRSTIGLFDGVATAKRIQLHADASRAVYSWCDAMQVKQALVNLISNALKFTPPGGRIDVIARPGPPASARGGTTSRRDVEIVVMDTGPGIPVDDRERIFERGVRLERDRATPGTGVGLAIVRDVMDLHGGIVRIDETPGGGTSIALVFPVDLRARSGEHLAVLGPSNPPAPLTSVPPSSPRRGEMRRDSE